MTIRSEGTAMAERRVSFGALLRLAAYGLIVVLMLGLTACDNSAEFEAARKVRYPEAYNRQYPISFKDVSTKAYRDAERAAYAQTRADLLAAGMVHRSAWTSAVTSAVALLAGYLLAHFTAVLLRKKGLVDDLTGRLPLFDVENIWSGGQQS